MAWEPKVWTGRQRGILLGGLLVATLVAVAWVSQQEDEAAVEVVASKKEKSASQKTEANRHLALEKLQRARPAATDAEGAKVDDVFRAKSWYVPPPPPKPVPPPPPAPPPLPFTYMGRLLEDDKLTIFLSKQDRHFAVKAGDTLDAAYRVDSVSAQQVVLTYLPLNMQQTLILGGAN